VERAPGVSYKAQRTPSYCDRILWKSMPPCEGQLALRWICAIAEVSTSDHKPVVAAFGLSPTAPIRQSTSNQVVVRVSDLALRDIVASDWTGTSDPFCCFFTHPDGLLTDYFTPKTSVKYRVRPGQQSVATGDAKLARSLTKQLSRMQSSPVIKGMMGSKPLCRWADKEVPQLVMNVSIDHLDQACLLIGIFDFDRFTKNDPLGVVTIPLAPPTAAESAPEAPPAAGPSLSPVAAAPNASSSKVARFATDSAPRASRNSQSGALGSAYNLYVDQPITLFNSTKGTGRLSCSLRVSRRARTTALSKGTFKFLRMPTLSRMSTRTFTPSTKSPGA